MDDRIRTESILPQSFILKLLPAKSQALWVRPIPRFSLLATFNF